MKKKRIVYIRNVSSQFIIKSKPAINFPVSFRVFEIQTASGGKVGKIVKENFWDMVIDYKEISFPLTETLIEQILLTYVKVKVKRLVCIYNRDKTE